jgi:hypothetical protein
MERISKTETVKVDPAIEQVFRLNPELSNIGSIETYKEYLQEVFPQSVFKEIAWHNSDAEFKDEGFKPVKPNFDTLNSIEGVYNFSTNQEFVKQFGKNSYAVVLDIQNPYEDSTSGEYADDMDGPLSQALYVTGIKAPDNVFAPPFDPNYSGCDAVINTISGEGYIAQHPVSGNEIGLPAQKIITVFDNRRIHILGSKMDEERFRVFAGEKNKSY